MTAPATLLCDDPGQPPSRLAVDDDGDLITIEEQVLTSRSPTARVASVRSAIDMTEDEARWLHEALGVVLRKRAVKAVRKPR